MSSDSGAKSTSSWPRAVTAGSSSGSCCERFVSDTSAAQSPTFYAEPGDSPDLDEGWQNAVGTFAEEDFETRPVTDGGDPDR